jgi:hypothetical protein
MLRKSYFIAIVVGFAIIVVAGVYQRLVPGLSQEKKARMARPR